MYVSPDPRLISSSCCKHSSNLVAVLDDQLTSF